MVNSKIKRTTYLKYNIGDEVFIFNTNSKRFDEKGVISSFTPNTNSYPSSFCVKMRGGHTRIVNQAWLHPFPSC